MRKENSGRSIYHMCIWEARLTCRHECERPPVPINVIAKAKRQDIWGGVNLTLICEAADLLEPPKPRKMKSNSKETKKQLSGSPPK